jgi:hypothetical protein
MSEQQQTEQAAAAAERVVTELKEKAAALVARQEQLSEERKRLSYSALVEKDTGAIKKMAALAVEAQRLADETEANARLAAAYAAKRREGDRENAHAIRAALEEFTEAALSLDEALTAIGEEGAALFAAVRKLHALGVTHPSDEQVRVLGLQCLQTALMAAGPWAKEFPHLAPRDRRLWAALARTWSANIIANHIEPVLGEAESADAAA